jgi:hypothetical protein
MRRLMTTLALAVGLAALPAAAGAQDHVVDDTQDTQLLYVVSTTSGSFDGDTLTLEGVPAVLYFSDRPARIAGHVSVNDFVAGWDQGSDSFAGDPPNAALSVLGANETVVELTSVVQDGDTMTFGVTVIDGILPETFGPASLFIDYCMKNPLACPS